MTKRRCQVAGAVAAVSGLVWLGWAIAVGLTGQRSGLVLVAVAVSSLGVVVGHYAVEDFYGQRLKRPGTAGAWLGALGGVVFAVGQLLRVATDSSWEWVIGIGGLALAAGSFCVAAGLVRTRIQPPWLGVALAVGTLGFLGFDVSASAAALYGLAWVALGQDLYRYDPPDGRFGDSRADYGWLS